MNKKNVEKYQWYIVYPVTSAYIFFLSAKFQTTVVTYFTYITYVIYACAVYV